MPSEYEDIRNLCKNNDVPALKKVFSERNIGPDDWKAPKSIPVDRFLLAAGFENPKADVFEFLGSYFSGMQTNLSYWLLTDAIKAGNVPFVAAVCKLDPDVVNTDGHLPMLYFACSSTKNPEIINTLLDAGARPDDRSGHLFLPNSYAFVEGGFPASTLDRFFDAGYTMKEGPPIKEAVEKRRADLVEVFYRRGRQLPHSVHLPGAEQLMGMAKESKDEDMIAMVRRLFPEKYSKRRSIFGRLFGR